jgi:hypothetical protein
MNIFVAKFVPGSSKRRVASACGLGAVWINDVENDESQGSLAFQEPGREMILSLAFARFAPSMMFIARTGARGALSMCDLRSPGLDVSDALAPSATHVPLSSIAFHPRREYEFALASEGDTVLMYDARKLDGRRTDPIRAFSARRDAPSVAHRPSGVSCVTFSQNADSQRVELLANYRGAPLCIFDADASCDVDSGTPDLGAAPPSVPDGGTCAPLMAYEGRSNVTTFAKQAAFWGDDDAFVLTGGDCGSVFAWEKRTGQLVWRLPCDRDVVNCVAPHPAGLPLFAASGIDSSVKLCGVDGSDEKREPQWHWSEIRDAALCSLRGMQGAVDHAAFREKYPAPRAANALAAARVASCLSLAEGARARGAALFGAPDLMPGALHEFARGAAILRGMQPGAMLEKSTTALAGMLRTDFAESDDTLHIFRSFPADARRRATLLSKCELNMAAVLVRMGSRPFESGVPPDARVEQWRAVRVLCTRVLARDPRSVKALYRRARAFGAANTVPSLNDAIRDLKHALAVDPSCAAAAKLLRVMVQRKSVARKRLASNLRKAFTGSTSSSGSAEDGNADSSDNVMT